MHQASITLLLASSAAIAGCRSTVMPVSVSQSVTTSTTNDTPINSGGPWTFTPSSLPHMYHSISQTTIHELPNLNTRKNTIKVNTTFTILLDQSHTPLAISGRVDSIAFYPDSQLSIESKTFILPLLFDGELTPVALRINIKNAQFTGETCSPLVNSVLGDLRTVIAIYPLRLTPSFTWRDSTQITTCTTGGIPITRKTIRLFRVVGERVWNTRRTLLLQQLDSIYISGGGAQGNHQIHLEGVGTGTASIYIDLTTSRTLATEFSEKLEIAISNSGKSQHFLQEVTQRVEALN